MRLPKEDPFLWSETQVVKFYEARPIWSGKHSLPKVSSTERNGVSNHPDMSKISKFYVEKTNLTMRMLMRRFKRLANALSKNADNLKTVVALHLDPYDDVKYTKRLRRQQQQKQGLIIG